jgi:hypothetical protein
MREPKLLTHWLRADGTSTPNTLRIEGCSADFELLAEDASVDAAGDKPKRRKFAMTAYTGGAMRAVGFGLPVVLDLAGVEVPRQDLPILRQHDPERIVGHTASIEITPQRIRASGIISGTGDAAQEVIGLADNGFPWQASIGASVQRLEFVDRDQTVKVNGKSFTGPLYVVRASVLGEISFVPMGADSATSASVSANRENPMNFEQWLAARGFNSADLNEVQKAALRSAFEAEQEAAKVKPLETKKPEPDPVEALRAKLAAETARVTAIQAAGKKYDVDGAKIDAAVRDGTDAKDFELDALRAARASVQFNTGAGRPTADNPRVIEAALAQAGRLEGAEKHFDAQTMQAAHDRYKGRLGLQELLLNAAMANGYHGSHNFKANHRDIIKAAFSGADINGILSNTANKFLLMGYMSVEQTLFAIAAKKNASDFKEMTSYRMTGAFQYELIGPGGEIPHGKASEQSFTNKVDTYGVMFAVTRQDQINDDLGALTALPQRIGRGAGLKVNDVGWTAFLDNSTFFTSGNNNYFEGAATNLQASSLKTAVQKFRKLTDPDGKPLGVEPRILLVPPEEEQTADELYTSGNYNTGGAATTAQVPNRNTHAGKYRPAVSAYLSNTSYTGYSTTGWYLLADPMDEPVIELAYLNGVESPTVETADADFNVLGIQMRGYHDFGVRKQSHRGGVKSKGAA